MRIEFERSGGFAAPMQMRTTIDAASLAPEERTDLERMIKEARFFALPPRMLATQPGGDRFQYTVTVETADGRHTVEIDEAAASPAVRQLLKWLTAKSRQVQR